MSTDPKDMVFAWGADSLGDCSCPALAAGMFPPATVASIYDAILKPDATKEPLRVTGRVWAKDARATWLEAIRRQALSLRDYPRGKAPLVFSVRAARILGWLGRAWDGGAR